MTIIINNKVSLLYHNNSSRREETYNKFGLGDNQVTLL